MERMNEMNTIYHAHWAMRRGRVASLIAVAVAYLLWSCVAQAATTYHVSNAGGGQDTGIGGITLTNTDPLETAIDDINDRVANGANTDSANIELKITQDYSVTGSASLVPQWFLHGSDPTFTDYVSESQGFNNVTVNGLVGTNGRSTLEITGTQMSPVFGVINAVGTIDISYLNLKGGNIDVSNLPVNVGGAGLYVGASNNFHETAEYGKPFTTFNLSNVGISNNTVFSAATDASRPGAMGGGLFVSGYYGANPNGAVAFNNVDLIGNTAEVNAAAPTTSSAIGGGGRVLQVNSFTWNGGNVKDNKALATNASHAHAGGFAFDSDSDALITNVKFENNEANASGTNSDGVAWARGGGFYAYSNNTTREITLGTGTVFNSNEANASDNANSSMGGGAYFQGLIDAKVVGDGATTTFYDNNATTEDGTAMGGGIASWHQGLGAGTDATLTMTDVILTDNAAIATNGTNSSTGNALGGGVHSFNQVTATGGKFSENYAMAETGRAAGGAVYTQDRAELVSFTGTEFSENVASAATAQGGAIFQDKGALDLTDVKMTDNMVLGGVLSNAKGGAIFMNMDDAGVDSTLNLAATDGNELVIRDNVASDLTNVRSDGIYFASVNGTSNANANLNVDTNIEGRVSIYDSVVADINNGKNFAMMQTGTGEFNWLADNTFRTDTGNINFTYSDGVNTWHGDNLFETTGGGNANVDVNGGVLNWDGVQEFKTANGDSNIDFNGGEINLGDKFTAKTTGTVDNFNVTSANTALINFNASRDDATAMFDFTNTGITTKNLNIAAGTVLGSDIGREIASFDREYLVADGLSVADANTQAGNFVADGLISEVYSDGAGKIFAKASYRSMYDKYHNPSIAQNAVQQLVKQPGNNDGYLYTPEQVQTIRDNPRAMTAELILDHGHIFLNLANRYAENAVNIGLRQPFQSLQARPAVGRRVAPRAYESRAYNGESGFRIWAGYFGDFRNMDSHSRFNGYKTDTNGFVVGMNYDFSRAVSVGIYGGYSKTDARARDVDAKTDGDNYHFGVLGRVSPMVSLPNFSFFGDVGYFFSNNDTYRNVGGGRANGSFDQDYWTASVGVENSFCFGNFNVIPSASFRWAYLDQDGMDEGGFTRSHVDGFDKHTFASRLGVDLSYDFHLPTAVVTPKVGLAWRHDFGPRTFSANSFYLDAANPIHFRPSSSRNDRDSMDINAAINTVFNVGGSTKLGVDVGYQYNVSRHTSNHTVYAGLSLGF